MLGLQLLALAALAFAVEAVKLTAETVSFDHSVKNGALPAVNATDHQVNEGGIEEKSIDRFTFYTCPIRPLLTSRGAPPPTSPIAAPETEPSFIFFGGGASAGSSVGFSFRPPPPLCSPALCTFCIEEEEEEEEREEEDETEEEEEEPPAPPPPADPYPSQSGMETHPASRYVLSGLLGMLEGRLPLLLYSLHSASLPNSSVLTKVLAASKERAPPLANPFVPSYPSQLA